MSATRPSQPAIKLPWFFFAALGVMIFAAFVSTWGGWVTLGAMTGFGVVHPFPGTPWEGFSLNVSIALPFGVDAYAALTLWAASVLPTHHRAFRFAAWSAGAALVVGVAGQAASHLLVQFGHSVAPWWVTLIVSTIPVVVLGATSWLAHQMSDAKHGVPAEEPLEAPVAAPEPVPAPQVAPVVSEPAEPVLELPAPAPKPRSPRLDDEDMEILKAHVAARLRSGDTRGLAADVAKALGKTDRTAARFIAKIREEELAAA